MVVFGASNLLSMELKLSAVPDTNIEAVSCSIDTSFLVFRGVIFTGREPRIINPESRKIVAGKYDFARKAGCKITSAVISPLGANSEGMVFASAVTSLSCWCNTVLTSEIVYGNHFFPPPLGHDNGPINSCPLAIRTFLLFSAMVNLPY